MANDEIKREDIKIAEDENNYYVFDADVARKKAKDYLFGDDAVDDSFEESKKAIDELFGELFGESKETVNQPDEKKERVLPSIVSDDSELRDTIVKYGKKVPKAEILGHEGDSDVMSGLIRKYGPSMLNFAAPEIKNDKSFLLRELRHVRALWFYIAPEIRYDFDFFYDAIRMRGVIEYVSWDIVDKDKLLAMEAMNVDGSKLEKLSLKSRSDRDIVLAAVKNCGKALQYASKELRADRFIVTIAVCADGVGSVLQYASKELRADRELVEFAIEQRVSNLAYASDELRADKELVKHAVDRCGIALQYASDELRADKEIVLLAVNKPNGFTVADALHGGFALQYASLELRADKEVVLAAVKSNGEAFKFAVKKLRKDKDMALAAIKANREAYRYVIDLQKDPDVKKAYEESRK